MERYDLTAEMYDERYAEEQKAKYKAALKKIVVPEGILLDVGCGSGLFFGEVATKSGMIVGVDISHKLLLKAKELAEEIGNVSVLQADADHLPFKAGFFDVVFAFTVLQNMPKPLETIKGLVCVAKLGGRVVVTGLKKAFSLNLFLDILEDSGMKIVSFVDNEDLKCYVGILAS